MTITEPPRLVRRFWQSPTGQRLVRLLEPSKYWIMIFIVGLIAVNIWALVIQRTQAADEATHAAEIQANAKSQFTACLKSIPVLKKFNDFVEGDRIIRNALVKNALANKKATPVNDPSYATKVANLNRLRTARAQAFELKFPIPTFADCRDLRARLLEEH